MPDYITPEQCEAFPGCKSRSHGSITEYDIPAGSNGEGSVWVVYVSGQLRHSLSVNGKLMRMPPTLSNVRRLLSALRGEMSDAEMALEALRRLNESGGDVSLTWDDGSWQVEEWDGQNYIAVSDSPLAAVEAAAKALGVELGEGE